MRQIATNSRRSRAYKRSFLNSANKIEDFERHLGRKLTTRCFNEVTTEEYFYYLNTIKPYRVSTLNNFRDKLSFTLNRAFKNGIKVNWGFMDFRIGKDDPFSIALTTEEIFALFELKGLSPGARAVRDWFVIGCCTGLRISDMMILNSMHISNVQLFIKNLKTRINVDIPIHWMIEDIIKRNYGLPFMKSAQNFNKIIKGVAKKAGIIRNVLCEQVRGGKLIRKTMPANMFISSCVCRKSFATNLYLSGVPLPRILLLTGHKTEESFFKYVHIEKRMNARILSEHPFFNRVPPKQIMLAG